MPGATAKASKGVRTVRPEDVKNQMIVVEARVENGQTRIEIEKQPVAEGDLSSFLARHVRATRKLTILIDAAPEVEWNTVAAVMDAARGAGIMKTLFLQRK